MPITDEWEIGETVGIREVSVRGCGDDLGEIRVWGDVVEGERLLKELLKVGFISGRFESFADDRDILGYAILLIVDIPRSTEGSLAPNRPFYFAEGS